MANKILNSQLLVRNDTAANWAVSTLILGKGEIALDTDNHILKIGNGVDIWSNLQTITITEDEKSAINHINRSVLDALGDASGALTYNGNALAGGFAPNLTLTTLTLGHYQIAFDDIANTLVFAYVV